MRLQERLKRVQSKTEALRRRGQETKDQQHAVYLWDCFERVPLGQDSEVLLKYLTLWLEGDNDAVLAAYPLEEHPNLYMWISAVSYWRADLAPEYPVTRPLSAEEIEKRLALLPQKKGYNNDCFIVRAIRKSGGE